MKHQLTSNHVEQLLQLVRLDARSSAAALLDADTSLALLPLVKYEGVAAWFADRLHETGQLPDTPTHQAELRGQRLHDVADQLKLAAVTARVVRLLAAQGIRVVLLKGVAYLALGDRHPYFRFRRTSDIDLLVEPGSSQRAWQLVLDSGLGTISPASSVHPDHHHHPRLVADLDVSVEIHSSASLFWSDTESWSRLGAHAREFAWQGLPVLVPPPTELLWHELVHSLGDGSDGCRLRSLLTAAAFMVDGNELDRELIGARIDGEQIREHDSRQLVPTSAVRRWLSVAAWLAGAELPAGMRDDSARIRLTRLLDFRRRRLEASADSHSLRKRTADWMEEATRAELGLGMRRLGHWQPRRRRPKRLVSSLGYRLLYWAAR